MIVSQFTVEQSPIDGSSKFYRLLLTNLADKDYSFRIFVHSQHEWVDQKVAYVIGEWDQLWRLDLKYAGPNRYQAPILIDVGAHATKTITLGPSGDESSVFVRGYLELIVPESYTKTELYPKYWYTYEVEVSQGMDPVPVLLHPSEVNGRWAKTGYTHSAAITVSTGQAQNEILPEKLPTAEFQNLLELVVARWTAASDQERDQLQKDVAAFVEAPDSALSVMAYLGRVGAQAKNLDPLNALLAEAGHPIRLTTAPKDRPPRRSEPKS
jgi:hypothetical protein